MPVPLLCALALGAPADPPPAPPAKPHVAALVNGEEIRLDQVDALLRRLPAVRAPLTAAQVKRLRTEAVQDLIDDALLRQFLRKHGPKVEPVELEEHARALAAALRRQGKTPADFYRETGQTEQQVRDSWTTLLQFQKYVDQQAKPEELKKYFEANKDFFDGVTVRVSQVVVRVLADAPPGERASARPKVAGVRADVLAGKLTFAEAARKHSVDATAAAGGDLGFVGRRDGVLDEPVVRAAFALKAGEVSEPTDADLGVYLVQVTERKPGTPASFEKSADLVRELYAEDVRRSLVGLLRGQATLSVTIP